MTLGIQANTSSGLVFDRYVFGGQKSYLLSFGIWMSRVSKNVYFVGRPLPLLYETQGWGRSKTGRGATKCSGGTILEGIVQQGSIIYSNPNNALLRQGEITEKDDTFALFGPYNIGSLMIPVQCTP